MAKEFIDPTDFNERNNIGKVSIAQDADDPDVLIATVVTHNEKDGSTVEKTQRLSKSYAQIVFDNTIRDAANILTMMTAMGEQLDTTSLTTLAQGK